MRSILVMADHRPGSEIRLETAVELARQRDGHLTVLIDTPLSRFIASDPMGGNYIVAEALDRARQDDDTAAAAITDRLARSGVPFDVVRSEDDLVGALAASSRLNDLVVVSRTSGLAGNVALASRIPVLVLPDGAALQLPIRRACIAWDGGDQAAAALRAAVPLLKSCQLIKVVSVIEKAGGVLATDALRYLSRHGIHADYEEHERHGSTEQTLAIAVGQSQADLLVMGAYGKSRMREFLFGGVTAHFLDDASAPALLLQH